MKYWFALPLLFGGLVGIDRVTKIVMFSRSAESAPFLLPGIIEFTHHRNFGIIANIPLPRFAIIAITFVVMALLVVGFKRAHHRKEFRETLPLTLILAGSVGNLWDRLHYGFVFDWVLLVGRSAVNLADAFIAVGLVWYLGERNVDERHEVPPSAWGDAIERKHGSDLVQDMP